MSVPPAPGSSSAYRRLLASLEREPILVLLFFSPGIIEYLSGSSQVAAIVTNPFLFYLQLGANLGLYGPGVLLIREAMIRWKKGWGTVLLLGFAYGILEEGVALSTMFNPTVGPATTAGLNAYGHYMGVNWVWAVQIATLHALFSIALPIALLDLAIPRIRGRSLLRTADLPLLGILWGVDVAFLYVFVGTYTRTWTGASLLLGAFAVIALLVLVARYLPVEPFRARGDGATFHPGIWAVIGPLFFLTVWFIPQVGKGLHASPVLTIAVLLAVDGGWLWWVLGHIGSRHNERRQVAFAGGLVAPLLLIGVVTQAFLPLVFAGDVALVIFLRALWVRYAPLPAPPAAGPPPGAAPPAPELGGTPPSLPA